MLPQLRPTHTGEIMTGAAQPYGRHRARRGAEQLPLPLMRTSIGARTLPFNDLRVRVEALDVRLLTGRLAQAAA